ncbi:restriction endonuclease [Actinomadura rayongensis]|uniref:Restriction endonuclease n=1 Tax=Actinomadura rayongensis TaxID=1429076 RepID=A0A6I4W3V9_9ACTN|nr:restriction endonuclease [Actinomadura rayongensis]
MSAPSRPGRSTAAFASIWTGAGLVTAFGVFLAVTNWQLFLTILIAAAIAGLGGGSLVLIRRREARLRRERLREIAHLDRVDVMSGTDFEFLTADLLRRDGFKSVEVVGRAGDRGVDVLATAPDGRRIAVQCKRQQKKVGSDRVRNLIGAIHGTYAGRVGVLVTNAGFTAPAVDEAAGRVILLDRAALARWMNGRPFTL